MNGKSLPRAHEIGIDGRLLAISLALAVGTSLLFSVLPALQLSRPNWLQSRDQRGGGATRIESRARAALVIAQLSMATVLLIGASLLMNSFVRLSTVDKGYDPLNALAFQLALPEEYPTARKASTIESLLTRLRTLPGIEAAGFSYAGILLGVENSVGVFVPPGGSIEAARLDTDRPRLRPLSHGYLEAMGVRILAGRGLDGVVSHDNPLTISRVGS